jgi:hypothetical protein
MPRRRRKLTCSDFINARATPNETRVRLAERDARRATDTRTPAQVWLGEPPPAQSALARQSGLPVAKPKKAVTLPTLPLVERLPQFAELGRSKRQEIARELVNGRGMSRRQAARLLGVGEATVRRDVWNDSANGAGKLRTTRELLAQSD